MKPVIRLFLFFFPLLCIFSCNGYTPDVPAPPAPRDSYDIRDPGLGEEHFGQVKWIFNLHIGQTKTLDIDGKSYTITLTGVKNNISLGFPYCRDDAFKGYLDVDGTTVDVVTFSVFCCKPEEDMTALCNERNLFICDFLKELFADPMEAALAFEGNFCYGTLIDNHTKIYIDVCYCRLPSYRDDTPIEDANLSFIIIKYYPK